MMIVTISEKGGQQSQYDFSTAAITIGRMKGNDIVLPKGNVSKKHSRISVLDGQLFISDMNSTNGTYVNGRKVAGEQPLSETDKIYIGDFILQVQAKVAGQAGPPMPPQQNANISDADFSGPGMAPGGPRPPAPPVAPMAPSLDGPSGFAGSVDDLFGGDTDGPGHRPSRNTIRESAVMRDSGGYGAATGEFDEESKTPAPAVAPGPGPAPRRRPSGPSPVPPAPPLSESGGFGAAPSRRDSGGFGAAPPVEHEAISSPGRSMDAVLAGRPAPPNAPIAGPRAGLPAGRLGGDSGERAAHRPTIPPQSIQSEFDEDFHAAQHDVARVLLESVSLDEMVLEYPPEPDVFDSFKKEVSAAVDVVAPSVDREALVDLMTHECVGLGVLDQYLDDPEVQDIYIQRADRILVRKNGTLSVAERAFSHPSFLMLAAFRLLGTREPVTFTDEIRFGDGTRAHVVMPPIAVDGPAITVRKPPVAHLSLDDLLERNVFSPGIRDFLEHLVRAGRSVLIAGPAGAGKTTLLGAMAAHIAPGTRVITIEESAHLQLPQDSVVRLEANPAVGYGLKTLVRTAVAMDPQRILLDECVGEEAYEWVSSAASGTEGSMVTAHGISAASALERIESLCLLDNPASNPRGLREQIARGIDFVVVLNRSDDMGFRVRQISELQGVDLDAFRLNDVFYHRVDGNEEQFHPTGYIPLFYEDLRDAGVDVDFDIFRD